MQPDTAKTLDAAITSLKTLLARVERDHDDVAETYVPRDVCERNTLRDIFETAASALDDLEHACRHAVAASRLPFGEPVVPQWTQIPATARLQFHEIYELAEILIQSPEVVNENLRRIRDLACAGAQLEEDRVKAEAHKATCAVPHHE